MSLAKINEIRAKEPGAKSVTVIRDKMPSEVPQLWLEVFVVGDKMEQQAFANMLVRANCKRATTVDDADLVIFTGGDDVNPLLYGEKAHKSTSYSNRRDEEDMAIYEDCVTKGVPMFGVCRGAQFLHVMNGGKLYQDVDNHYGAHNIWDPIAKKVVRGVSSVHHQMCIPNIEGGMTILGETSKSTVRWLNDTAKAEGPRLDVEAYFYRDTCCLGVQGHPEYSGYDEFTVWTFELLDKYVVCNPDIELRQRVRRMKTDILDARKDAVIKMLQEIN